MYCFFDLFGVACAVASCDYNAAAGGKPGEESYQRVDYRRSCSDGGKRLFSYIVANDDAVHRGVKLLEQISKCQWKRKFYYMLPYTAFSHQDFAVFSLRHCLLLPVFISFLY